MYNPPTPLTRTSGHGAVNEHVMQSKVRENLPLFSVSFSGSLRMVGDRAKRCRYTLLIGLIYTGA